MNGRYREEKGVDTEKKIEREGGVVGGGGLVLSVRCLPGLNESTFFRIQVGRRGFTRTEGLTSPEE